MTEIDTSTAAVERLMDGVTEGWRDAKDDNDCVFNSDGLPVAFYVPPRDRAFIAAARDLVPALAAERDALRAVLTKLEYWLDTDEDILAAMNEWDRADHLEKLEMIREVLKGYTNG